MGSVVFAFLLIMLAGGFVAYFGDRLGYVMGKKRVTLFGLRPRHTATALTVISGIVIGALTLAFLIGINQAFRIALLQGEQEIRTNMHLRRTNEHLLAEANSDKQAAVDAQKSSTDALARTEIAELGLSVAERNLGSEQRRTAEIQSLLTVKQNALASLTESLTAERASLAAVQQQVIEAKRDNAANLLYLKKGVMQRRGGNLIFRNQGELGRVVIDATAPTSVIRTDLVYFLDRLSRSANEHGASIGANGRAVVITTIEVFDQKAQDAGDFIDENGSLDALTSSIHSYGDGSVVVVATALGNSFDGDQVIIMLRPYANILAIRAGDQIADTVIDGSSATDDEIAGQLQHFLVSDVRPAARRAGVIPVENPQTGADELGEITFHQLDQTVSQIHQLGGKAVVTATVDKDVMSADQLKLVFTVKPDTSGGI